MTYRKKPIEIEAFQFHGQPPREWPAWAKDDVRIRYEITNLQIDVNTGGACRCNRGDWVIRGIGGEVYPCTDALFHQNYETIS